MARRPSHLRGTDIAIYEKDGALYGLDDSGEFPIDNPRGNTEPQDGLCNAVLKLSEQRYGEIRYCGKTPYWPADDSDEEPSDYCRHHKSRDMAIKNAIDLLKHGYFGQHYAIFEQSLDAHEFAFAVQMFAGLLEASQYDFEVEAAEYLVDAKEDWLIDENHIVVEVPIPQTVKYAAQASELWKFALDEIVEQRMQNIRLDEGVSGEHVVATADEDGVITDRIEEKSEHHLNLPISRLTKDKKERLKIGGVEVGAEEGDNMLTFTTGDYVLDLADDVPEDEELPEFEETLTAELEPPDDDE